MEKKQIHVTWIQTALYSYIKTEVIYTDIAKDVEQDLILQIMHQRDHCQKGKNIKVIGIMKDELPMKRMKRFAVLRYPYLTDNNDKDKKQKTQKICHKRKT